MQIKKSRSNINITLSFIAILLSSNPALSYISRENQFRFCENDNTMQVAEIAMKSLRFLGEDQGSIYYRTVVKDIYKRTSDSEWNWIEDAHERILKALITYRKREGRFMITLDKDIIMKACNSAIPSR